MDGNGPQMTQMNAGDGKDEPLTDGNGPQMTQMAPMNAGEGRDEPRMDADGHR